MTTATVEHLANLLHKIDTSRAHLNKFIYLLSLFKKKILPHVLSVYIFTETLKKINGNMLLYFLLHPKKKEIIFQLCIMLQV